MSTPGGLADIGLRRLVASILVQAMQDTQNGDDIAKAWLLQEGSFYLLGLGIDIAPERWQAFVMADCPGEYSLRRRKDKRIIQES